MATIAIGELTRPLRWVNVVLDAGSDRAMAARAPRGAHVNGLAAGMLTLGCSLVKQTRAHQFGGGWSSLWKGVPPDGGSQRS